MKQRRKVSRFRGKTTHGWGSMKKRRGAGNRGGRGNAGTGKRADQNKPKVWANRKYFGKHGFKCPTTVSSNACSLRFIEYQFDQLVALGKIKEEKGIFVVDLKSLGYTKLLGNGNVTRKYKVLVASASASSVEKITQAGGEVALLDASQKKEAPQSKPVQKAVPVEPAKQEA